MSSQVLPITARSQQRYDHRFRHLVHRTGDVTLATNLGVLALALLRTSVFRLTGERH